MCFLLKMSGVLKSYPSQLDKNDSFKPSALDFISVVWMRAPIEKLMGFIMHVTYFLRLRDAGRMRRNAGLHFLISIPLLKVWTENVWVPDKRHGGECADLTQTGSVLLRRRADTGNLEALVLLQTACQDVRLSFKQWGSRDSSLLRSPLWSKNILTDIYSVVKINPRMELWFVVLEMSPQLMDRLLKNQEKGIPFFSPTEIFL